MALEAKAVVETVVVESMMEVDQDILEEEVAEVKGPLEVLSDG